MSYAVNMVFSRTGVKRITIFGPMFEEAFKTGAALFFNVSIPATHIFFGFVEAVYDYFWGKRKRVLAGLFSLFTHAVFGLITFFLIKFGVLLYLSVAAAAAVHIALNMAVIKISEMKFRRNTA